LTAAAACREVEADLGDGVRPRKAAESAADMDIARGIGDALEGGRELRSGAMMDNLFYAPSTIGAWCDTVELEKVGVILY
jgi:hypothetical protein